MTYEEDEDKGEKEEALWRGNWRERELRGAGALRPWEAVARGGLGRAGPLGVMQWADIRSFTEIPLWGHPVGHHPIERPNDYHERENLLRRGCGR